MLVPVVPVVPVALFMAGPSHLLKTASAVYNLTAVEFLAVTAYFFRQSWRSHRTWSLGRLSRLLAMQVDMQLLSGTRLGVVKNHEPAVGAG